MASSALIDAYAAIKRHIVDIQDVHRDKENKVFVDPSRFDGVTIKTGKLYKINDREVNALLMTSYYVRINVYDMDGKHLGGYAAHTLIDEIK